VVAIIVAITVAVVIGDGAKKEATNGPSSTAAISGSGPGQAVDHVTFALNSGIPNLFIPNAWLISTGAAMSLVQSGLLAFDTDLKLGPAIADEWSQPDPTTYVFHLRPDVMFSDGTALTAEDVVYSMEWNIDPANASQLAAFYAGVESIVATSDSEITIKLSEPNAQFIYTVAHMSGFVFSKSQYEKDPKNFGTPALIPVGTGPYKVVSFTPDQSVTLSVNPHYYGEQPKVASITLKTFTDAQAVQLAMRSGQIDGAFEVPITSINQWKQIDSAQVITEPSLNVLMLVMNVTRPPFNDVHVRRAVWHAIDREGLVKAALKGYGEVANAINPPEMWANLKSPDDVRTFYDTLTPPEFDMAKAKAEMAKSKYPKGFSISTQISSTVALMAPIAESLTNTLGELGIKLSVTTVDSSVYFSSYINQKNNFYVRAYAPDFPDPVNYPYLFLYGANAVKNGMNAAEFKNPGFDGAIDTGLTAADPQARIDAIEQALRIVDDQVPIAPIFFTDTAVAVSNRLQLNDFSAFYYNQTWALGLAGR